MRVWLDDLRAPPDDSWAWVKAAHECIPLLASGKVKVVSLDHDLGEEDVFTGYSVLTWIEQMVHTDRFKPPEMRVHSMNPVGRQNMLRAISAIEAEAARQARRV